MPARKSSKRQAFYKFYFLRPKENADADLIAERLMDLSSVQEVFLTEGDFGYVVKARFFNGKEPKDVTNYISKAVDNKFGEVLSHMEYKKRPSASVTV